MPPEATFYTRRKQEAFYRDILSKDILLLKVDNLIVIKFVGEYRVFTRFLMFM